MFVKLLAALFILIGIAGLVLPVIPGILMIIIGALLLYGDRQGRIAGYIDSNAPGWLVNFYDNFLHKLITPPCHVGIDWTWVKKELTKTERITSKARYGRSGEIISALEECLLKARRLVEPKFISIEKNISAISTEAVELEDGVKFLSGKIPEYIKGAEILSIFLVTIGDALEKEASLLSSGKDLLKGYLFDRIGSFAVESMAESFENNARKRYALIKKSVSSRFSPGYCDWPIEEQFKLAKILDFSKIGVRLTDGCMMVPKKSISAIVAVGDEGVFKKFVSGCAVCEKKDCGYRKPS